MASLPSSLPPKPLSSSTESRAALSKGGQPGLAPEALTQPWYPIQRAVILDLHLNSAK